MLYSVSGCVEEEGGKVPKEVEHTNLGPIQADREVNRENVLLCTITSNKVSANVNAASTKGHWSPTTKIAHHDRRRRLISPSPPPPPPKPSVLAD